MDSAHTFSISDLVQQPRRSPAVVNAKGTYAAYTCTVYSLADKTKDGTLCIFNVTSNSIVKVIRDKAAKEPVFASDLQLLYLVDRDDKTALHKFDIEHETDTKMHQFSYAISNLKYNGSGTARIP